MKLISCEPHKLTPLIPHESMHPGQGHLGVTTVLNSLGTSLGLIKQYTTPMDPVKSAGYSEMGYLWEQALEEEYKKRETLRQDTLYSDLITQDKQCVDGIHLIPDAYCLVPKKIGHEYKLTFKFEVPAEELLEKNWTWGMQTKCYGHVLGILEWHFFVCWLARFPNPKHYIFKYTKKECKEAWEELLKHADFMRNRNNTEVNN